jgi:hypothetical protein
LPAGPEQFRQRRRLRRRRQAREAMLLDLGALVYELHRQGRRAPELLQEKAAQLSVIDDEVRRLEGTFVEGETAEWDAQEEPEEDQAEQAEVPHP